MAKIVLIATMDTKAAEARFLREALCRQGLAVCLVDTGILKESPRDADITQRQVLGSHADDVKRVKTRAEASVYMQEGLCRVIREAYDAGQLDAAVSLGGSGGTALASAAMHQLPMLKGCDVHSTVILSSVDADTLKKLGMNLTCDPVYEETGRKYHKI